MAGLGAGFFVIMAFYMRDQRLLRACAIVSNLLFVIYAASLSLWPVLVLHLVLLPLNAYRLFELTNWNACPEVFAFSHGANAKSGE
ncbi:MAG: hypothetical protein LJE68_11770 [Rhodobacter sp.]|nr:hypothetical protein [Rhodobacter sp.]